MSCLNQVIDQPLARQPKLDRPQFLIVKNGHGSGLYIYIYIHYCVMEAIINMIVI
jgi:hypothetical protein